MVEWDKKSPNQCEVIDFSLAICNDDFKHTNSETGNYLFLLLVVLSLQGKEVP